MAKAEFLPFDIGRMVIAPGHNPYIFKAVFGPKALFERGILARVASCFEEHGASILTLQTSTLPGGKVWIYIAADVEGDGKAEEIVSCISQAQHLEDAEYSPPIIRGVNVDAWGFPPIIGGSRVLAVRKPILEEFLRRGWRLMGGGFGIVLYHTFFKAGQEIFRILYSKMTDDPSMQVRLGEAVFRILGYGALDIVELASDRARVRVYDSIECESLRGVAGAESSIVRGIIAGFLAGLWGLEINQVSARETRCIRRGDPYCEIVVEKRVLTK